MLKSEFRDELNPVYQNSNGFDPQPDHLIDRCIIVSRQVQNIEELSQAMRGVGCTMTQLSAGRCHGEVLTVQMSGLQLIRITTNASVYTSGIKSADRIIFTTLLTASGRNIISHKTALPHRSLFGFDATREVSLITPEQMDLAIVIVPNTQLQKHLNEVERNDLNDQFFKCNHVQVADTAHYLVQTYLQQTFYLAITNPAFLRRSQPLIKGDLLPLLVNCFNADNSSGLRVRPFRRSLIVQQAEDFILAHLDRPLTLQDICQAVRASKSALSYGFQEIFGMSPMAYLKIRRLNGVRHALQKGNPTTDTVLKIANHYGFWHMGRFSTDYKQMFGESPSETLKGNWHNHTI